MCEPISLAALAITAAQQGAQLLGQAKAYNANAASAAQSLRIQNTQTNIRTQQSEASNSLKAQQSQTDMLKAAATAAASAGENGTAGNSVDALINDYHASEGRYLNSLDTQNQWNRAQGEVDKQGQQAQAQSRINSVAKPDYLGAALRIASAGVDKYSAYKQDAARNPSDGTN